MFKPRRSSNECRSIGHGTRPREFSWEHMTHSLIYLKKMLLVLNPDALTLALYSYNLKPTYSLSYNQDVDTQRNTGLRPVLASCSGKVAR